MYEVLNKNNAAVWIEDKDIDAYIFSGEKIRREIVQAMGKTHREEYLQYLYPALYHEQFEIRSDAAQSIFNINGNMGLMELKKREEMLDESELECEPSEKAMLQAMILRVEGGPEAVEKYFLSDDGYEIVKYDTPFCYRSGYGFKEADIEILCFVLEQCQRKSAKWLKELSKTDYNEMIYFTLESIWLAGKEMNILKEINSGLSERIYIVSKALLEQGISADCKELIARISLYIDRVHALKILLLLKGNVKGSARRIYKKSLVFWDVEEDEL